MFSTTEQRHLLAAEGWLELGDYAEADAELDCLPPQMRAHPDVLKIRWQVYAVAKKWEGAIEIANAIKTISPRDSFGWIHAAFALHELKRTLEALEVLIPARNLFPLDDTVCYNLACYAAQLGRLGESRRWLEKSIELGDGVEIKTMALNDPDLEPLWQNIGKQ